MTARTLNSVRLRRALRATYWLIANSAAGPLLRSPLVERGRRRMTATRMETGDLIEALGWLAEAQVKAWLAGGWACDALLGEQTREHSDVDLVVPDTHGPRAFETLTRRGFSIYERRQAGLLNCAVELIDRRRRRIALHLVEVDGEGRGEWPRSIKVACEAIGLDCPELFATGQLGGHRIACMSAAAQLVLHTGYPPGKEDRHNVRLLCSRFMLPLPRGYLASGTTALLVPVPEAEPLFDRWSGARIGVPGLPPHVTVLYPFLPESAIDPSVESEIERLASETEPFRYSLSHLDRFPGVLYIAPRPAAPFADLTKSVHAAWPAHPPYEGAYREVVPHVTLALDDEPRGLVAAVQERLPIDAVARELHLLTFGDDDRWSQLRRFRLGESAL